MWTPPQKACDFLSLNLKAVAESNGAELKRNELNGYNMAWQAQGQGVQAGHVPLYMYSCPWPTQALNRRKQQQMAIITHPSLCSSSKLRCTHTVVRPGLHGRARMDPLPNAMCSNLRQPGPPLHLASHLSSQDVKNLGSSNNGRSQIISWQIHSWRCRPEGSSSGNGVVMAPLATSAGDGTLSMISSWPNGESARKTNNCEMWSLLRRLGDNDLVHTR
jgi:hypothetical protein